MTYQEFVNKYNGQYVDTDGYPKDWKWQCYDLVQLYNTEVINVPYSVFQGCEVVKNMILWDWKYNELMQYFDEVDVHNMQQGDVCIWTDGPGGHTAIYDHYDGVNCWYFSQNPNPCEIMVINMNGHHAFRRKQPTPPTPTPEVTPNVERDEYRDQLEVIADSLRVRDKPGLDGKIIGIASKGEGDKKYYNYYEKYTNLQDEYDWYRIADNQWIAHRFDWVILYPAKKDEYKQYKILEKKDGKVLIDIGKVWVEE